MFTSDKQLGDRNSFPVVKTHSLLLALFMSTGLVRDAVFVCNRRGRERGEREKGRRGEVKLAKDNKQQPAGFFGAKCHKLFARRRNCFSLSPGSHAA